MTELLAEVESDPGTVVENLLHRIIPGSFGLSVLEKQLLTNLINWMSYFIYVTVCFRPNYI